MPTHSTPPLTLAQVTNGRLLRQTRQLFTEHARATGYALCGKDFESELGSLPGEYAPPRGRLFAAITDHVAGCVALRPLDAERCEVTRLYVRPADRDRGIGRALVSAALDAAREGGYRHVETTTVGEEGEVDALLGSLGFHAGAGASGEMHRLEMDL